MKIQESSANDTAQNFHEKAFKEVQEGRMSNEIENSDIRQIKLNYIQLNKRATTANNNGIGRKIPQKANEQKNIQIVGGQP